MADSGWVSNPAESRAPLLLAVFWTLFGLTSIVLILRLWIKWVHNRWQPDDYILFLAWSCLLGYTIDHQYAVSLGYGKHVLDVPIENFRGLSVAGDIAVVFTMIGINAAKISFAVTMLQVTRNLWKWTKWLVWFIIISLILTAIPAVILPWVVCKRPPMNVTVPLGRCLNPLYSVYYGVFQAVYTAVTDFALALLPWRILWSVQMRPVEKIGVGVAMSLGFVAGAMAIVRAASIPSLMARDSSYDGVSTVLWADVELSATMIASCIPVLRKMIYEEVTTRNRSTGPSTGGSKTTQKGNHSISQGTTASNVIYTHELRAIAIETPEPIVYPNTPSSRWYTTATPDVNNSRRNSDEDTFLWTTDTTPSEGGQDRRLEKQASKSDRNSSCGEPEPVTPWPLHMRGRSF